MTRPNPDVWKLVDSLQMDLRKAQTRLVEIRSTLLSALPEAEQESPPPQPEPSPKAPSAQPFVAFLVDESVRLGAPLDARSKGHAAKIIAGLVAAGATDETLRAGITRLVERGRPISALADIVREVAVAPAAEPEVDYPLLPPVAYDWVEPR